jgi:hypothetical protein
MDAARARALEVARRMLASGAVGGSEQAAFHIVGNLRGVPFTRAIRRDQASGNAGLKPCRPLPPSQGALTR